MSAFSIVVLTACVAGTSEPLAGDSAAIAQRTGEANPSPDGSDRGEAAIWRPRPGTSWQWQLTGTIDTNVDASVFDIDLFTTDQGTIDLLRSRGRKVVCYFSAGSYEPDRPDSAAFPGASKGNVMDGWPDERWLDVRSAAVKTIMQRRLDRAVEKRCDGVEPDNVDGYANDTGFPLTAANQLAFNRFLATEAHRRNLAVALKNDLEQIPELVGDFDFAVNEECAKYDECDDVTPFIQNEKAVFHVEYGSASLASSVCPPAIRRNFDTLIKRLDLDAWRVACR